VHPEAVAVAVCDRCGDYHCAACHKRIAGQALCASCRQLPGVDYLEETRLRYWGKRDGFVWYFGGFSVLSQLLALRRAVPLDVATLSGQALWTIVGIAYLLLYRPARIGLIVAACANALVIAWRAAYGTIPLTAAQLKLLGGSTGFGIMSVVAAVLTLLLVIAAYQSPRNKLAFEIEIDESDLRRVYDTYRSNPLAMRAAWYGALSLFLPFSGAITLAMGAVALRRANLSAWPPRGGRKPALIGIVLSALGVLGWSALIATAIMARRS
jgi:hypothetical protein